MTQPQSSLEAKKSSAALSPNFQIKFAFLLLLAAAVLTLLELSNRLSAMIAKPEKTPPFANTMNKVRRQDLPRGSLGFVSAGGAQLTEYYYAQYALAPRLLRSDANAQWVLCRFQNQNLLNEARRIGRITSWIEIDFIHSRAKEDVWNPIVRRDAKSPLFFVRDCSNGLALFRRASRRASEKNTPHKSAS